MRDQRSAEAQQWRGLYSLAAWRIARKAQLRQQPLCELCLKLKRHTPATVVNHRTPHKGDWKLFTEPTNHQSVCKPHHDGSIQSEERRGYTGECDVDGWPTDRRHPANRA
jgi:5-methylcytosine-specific restriction protein A